MVLWFCCYKGSGQQVRPSCSKGSEEDVFWRAFTICLLSRKMVQAELDVILIGWKYATTITVTLIDAPNKNTKFFLLHIITYIEKRNFQSVTTQKCFHSNHKISILLLQQSVTTRRSVAGHTCPEKRDLCLPAASGQRRIYASSSSQQQTWGPTNHSNRLGTADASF